MIRFAHTADIHFGVENYGRIDPSTGIHSRLLDFERALNAAIDVAIERDVDFFLFAGDAYKTAHPNPTQQRLLINCFLRLHRAHIPVVIIVGNHDNPLSFGKAHALDLFGQIPLDSFHVIAQPRSFTIPTKSGPVQIVGVPWPTRSTVALQHAHLATSAHDLTRYISDTVRELIESYARNLDPSIPAVLTGHLTVSSGIFSGSEKRAIYGADPVFLPSQLAMPPFDYVALGHLHRHQNLNPEGIPIVYAGSIERVDFGERNEEKGFCIVTIEDKGKTTYEFIKTPIRPFIQLDIDVTTAQSQTDEILAALSKQTIDEAVVKIVYHLAPGMKDRVDLAALHHACASAQYLVGVFPIRPPEVRERRTSARVDMDFSTLIDVYYAHRPHTQTPREVLLQRAHELEIELAENAEKDR